MSLGRISRHAPTAALVAALFMVPPASSAASLGAETPPPGISGEPVGAVVEAYCTGARRDADAAYGLGWTLVNAGQMAAAATILQAAATAAECRAAVP